MSTKAAGPNKLRELHNAVKARERLLAMGEFSASPENGAGAIIFTSGESREDREVLAEHADELSRDRQRGFYGAEIIRQARRANIYDALADKDIASLAFLGDGSLGVINLSIGNDTFERVNWYSLARNAPHLKVGTTQERTCTGVYTPQKEVRIPLTSLIVADQRTIFGTVNLTFGNHAGYEIFNQHITQLFDEPHNAADRLRQPLNFDINAQ